MRPCVLVVDDEVEFVDLLRFELQRAGWTVLAADNGLDALLLARSERPDAVLLDLMLEGMDGFTVCETLRRQDATARIAVVMLSALSSTPVLSRARLAGASDFMTKPFETRELVRRLAAAVERSRQPSATSPPRAAA